MKDPYTNPFIISTFTLPDKSYCKERTVLHPSIALLQFLTSTLSLHLLLFLRHPIFPGGCYLFLLDKGDLDVAGAGHVGVDPTVGPVGSPPHLGGTVNLRQEI